MVNMLKFYPCFSFALDSSGQHVEILIRSIILDSRVVNMLRFNVYVLLFRILRMANMFKFYPCFPLLWIQEWSTCWCLKWMRSIVLGSRGQDVDIQWIRSSIWDTSVVNMLRFYPCFLLHWIRECSTWYPCVLLHWIRYRPTCWDLNGSVLLYWIRDWSTCWYSINMFFYCWPEIGQHVGILPMLLCCLGFESGQQ